MRPYACLNEFVANNIEELKNFQTSTACSLNRLIERGPNGRVAIDKADALYANFNKVIQLYNEELLRCYKLIEKKSYIFDSTVEKYLNENNIELGSFCIDEEGILVMAPEVHIVHWKDVAKYREAGN